MDERQHYDASVVLEDIAAAQQKKWFGDIKFEGIIEFLDRVKWTEKRRNR
jgi:hypothetical protein